MGIVRGAVGVVLDSESAAETITIDRPLQDIGVLTASEELDGGAVVPGFRTKVSEIFAI